MNGESGSTGIVFDSGRTAMNLSYDRLVFRIDDAANAVFAYAIENTTASNNDIITTFFIFFILYSSVKKVIFILL